MNEVSTKTKQITIDLKGLLDERKMTQKDLLLLIEQKCGITFRAAALSELYNNRRNSINLNHLEIIASALDINDISELIKLREYRD